MCISIICIFSCSTGHFNEYGIYVPNKPRYTLKSRINFDHPKGLDTVNLYQYHGYFDSMKNIFINEEEISKGWSIYDKYCSNGRVYSFGTDNLNENSLNPNYGSKGYYIYDKKRNEIKYEVFTNGNGGQYVILTCRLSENGDSLCIFENRKSRSYQVYIKKIIPKEWNKYKIDW